MKKIPLCPWGFKHAEATLPDSITAADLLYSNIAVTLIEQSHSSYIATV